MTEKELKKINSRIDVLISLYVHYKFPGKGLCLPAYESEKAKQKYCRRSRNCNICRITCIKDYTEQVRKEAYFKLSDFTDEEESK